MTTADPSVFVGHPPLVLVTGVMAAGKSTVAQALAESLPRAVHLRGDLFRRMIVTGREPITDPLRPEAEAQLVLRYQLSIGVAARYREAGFTVVWQDVIVGRLLEDVLRWGPRPMNLVVLCPSSTAVAAREAGRSKVGYGSDGVDPLDPVLRSETPRVGLWLDSTGLNVSETVDALYAGANRAHIR